MDPDRDNGRFVFVGDSPNDEPLFRSLENSIGVANIRELSDLMTDLPRYVTRQRGGEGFAEVVAALLEIIAVPNGHDKSGRGK